MTYIVYLRNTTTDGFGSVEVKAGSEKTVRTICGMRFPHCVIERIEKP